MVSNQISKINLINETADPFVVLEKQITQVVSNCRSIIRETRKNGKKRNFGKKKSNISPKKTNDNESNITLEKVAEDMSKVLDDLKIHLNVFKNKKDSFSDVVPVLEKNYIETNQKDNPVNPGSGLKINNLNKNTSSNIPNKINNGNKNFTKNDNNKNNSTSNNINTNKPISSNNNKGMANKNVNNKMLKMNANNSNNTSRNPDVSNVSKSSLKSPMQRNVTSAQSRNRNPPKKLLQPNRVNISREVYDPLGPLKDEVQRAIKEQKTFTIRGSFQPIRRALLNRGWVEKFQISYRDQVNRELKKFQTYTIPELLELIREKDIADICKKLIKSKLLADHQVDLYWSYNYESFKECSDKVKLTKINKFRREIFSYTSKQGLCEAAKKSFWFQIPGVSNMRHPRTYSLRKGGDTEEFIKDFNITAAMSMLKWVKINSITKQSKIISSSGKIPVNVFDFAVNECYKFIKKAKHEDIDQEIKEAMSHEWNNFLEYYYKTVHVGNHFKETDAVTESDLVRKATYILEQLQVYWPYVHMDGVMNIWILKPTNSSQGIGIHMCRTLKYVLGVIKANPNRRYIIQKYIERPLLIYKTKFDIRQWFVISSAVPLTIWVYKQCYLRFSSQTYNLRKLHESIHLTNNSVQRKYNKRTLKDLTLPSYNMWNSNQFKNYLSDIGYPRAFNDIIYPGMKQSITAAVLMHLDKIDQRKNCFELYGADFIITEDFKPWLLEINSNPALYASTPVTARMCPVVLEDVIKVVVDYEKDSKADTGGFELMYKEKLSNQVKKGVFEVAGKPLKPDYFYTPSATEPNLSKETVVTENTENEKADPATCIRQLGQGMRQTLENLLELLKQEKQRRQRVRNKSIESVLPSTVTETQTIGDVEIVNFEGGIEDKLSAETREFELGGKEKNTDETD